MQMESMEENRERRENREGESGRRKEGREVGTSRGGKMRGKRRDLQILEEQGGTRGSRGTRKRNEEQGRKAWTRRVGGEAGEWNR